MVINVIRLFSVILAAFLFAGCTTEQNSIFRSIDLDRGRSVVTDSSQRIIINTKTHPSSRPGRVNPQRIVCAEPSPDVASIVANTFGFGVNVLGKGNAALSGGQASALAQLAERTVTVQLLRDQMYRACEAYANGAISGTEYSLLMSRNNDAMVTLMLGEAASRTVGRQLAALGAAGASSASATMSQEIAQALEDIAEAASDEAEAKDDAADAAEREATANAVVQATDVVSSDPAVKNAVDVAEDAENDKEEAEAKAEEAKQRKETAQKLLAQAQASSSTAAGFKAGGFANGLPQTGQYDVGIAEKLMEMQKQYLDQGAEEHFISACIVELGGTSSPLDLVAGGPLVYDSDNTIVVGPDNIVASYYPRGPNSRTVDEYMLASIVSRLLSKILAENQGDAFVIRDDASKPNSVTSAPQQGAISPEKLEIILAFLNSPEKAQLELYKIFHTALDDEAKKAIKEAIVGISQAYSQNVQSGFALSASTSDALNKLLGFTSSFISFLESYYTDPEEAKKSAKAFRRAGRDFSKGMDGFQDGAERLSKLLPEIYGGLRDALIYGSPERQAISRYNRIAEMEMRGYSAWGRESEFADKHLRTMVALEDRSRQSQLAELCKVRLKGLLERENDRQRLQQVLKFLVDYETVRKAAKPGGAGGGDDKPSTGGTGGGGDKPSGGSGGKASTSAQNSDFKNALKGLLGDCAAKKPEEQASCLAKSEADLVAAIVSLDTKPPMPPKKSEVKPPPPPLLATVSYKSAAAAYDTYLDSAQKFGAVKIPECGKACIEADICESKTCRAQKRQGKKPDADDTACKERCIRIKGLNAEHKALEEKKLAHAAERDRIFSKNTLNGLERAEADYGKKYPEMEKEKDAKKKAALEAEIKKLETQIVEARNRYDTFAREVAKTAAAMDGHAAAVDRLPKE